MSLCKFSTESIANNKIELDNLFVSEFLPYAPDNVTKVYLFGLYLCSKEESPDNNLEKMSRILQMSTQDVIDSFLYWQEQGLVQVLSTEPIQVRYMPLKNVINNTKKFNKNKYATFNIEAQELLCGRMITPNEYVEYYTLLEAFHMEIEALIMIIAYCVKNKGTNIGYPYILTIAKNWASENVLTAQDVENKIKELESNSAEITEVFKALKQSKRASIEDGDIYNTWTKKLGFSQDLIVFVAKMHKKRKISFNFYELNSVLTKYYELKLLSTSEIEAYENDKQNLKDTSFSVLKALGLYYENIEPVVENYILPWRNLGFNEDTLKTIATYCFKKNVRTLDSMNTTTLKFFKLGLVTNEAICEHIHTLSQKDKIIKEMLEKLGVERNVNQLDRDFYKTWTEDWCLNEELINYGISEACGKLVPMQYLNKLFSTWKNKNITKVEEAKKCLIKGFEKNDNKTIKNDISSEDLNSLFDSLDEIEI